MKLFQTISAYRPKGLLAVAMLAWGAGALTAAAATVTSDRSDYMPGETVVIKGSGFGASDVVTVQVLHFGETDDNDTSTAHLPWIVPANSSGSFQTSWL